MSAVSSLVRSKVNNKIEYLREWLDAISSNQQQKQHIHCDCSELYVFEKNILYSSPRKKRHLFCFRLSKLARKNRNEKKTVGRKCLIVR